MPKIDRFVLAMLCAVGLAFAWPALGSRDGPLHTGVLATIGIAFVFFLHGANLTPQALKAGAANWPLHLLVQGATFVLFPAFGALIFFGLGGVLPQEVRLGIFYLCAISSTISSSVAMTGIARGNVAGAVFDATLSGLIGMVATPLLVAAVADASGSLAVGAAILDVMQTLLLPFALGQLARPLIARLIARHRAWVTRADRAVILLIVWSAFSNSVAAGLWVRYDVATIGGVAVLAVALLFGALAGIRLISRSLGFPPEDEAAALFCGSTKSLANGAPIASVLFAGNPALGMIMLPLLLYHQAQLIVCSSVARRYALRGEP